eukprot:291490_1
MTYWFQLLYSVLWFFISTRSEIENINGWNTEKYYLPREIVGEHSAGLITNDYMYHFGGIKLEPFMKIDKVSRLNINNPKEWNIIANMTTDDEFEQPWFPSTKGANKLESEPDYIFLTCEDSQKGQIWKFNIYTFEFEIVNTMPIPLEDCCAVSSGNKIYIFGGDDNGETKQTALNYTQIYDYSKNEWLVGENIPIEGVNIHTCENFNDEYIYIFGGMREYDYPVLNANKNVYKYDIKNDKWITIENVFENDENYKDGIAFMGANYIIDTQYILLSGGETFEMDNIPKRWVNNVLLFNTETDEIETDFEVPQMNENRGGAVYGVDIQQKNKKTIIVKVYAIGGRSMMGLPIFATTTETIEFTISCSDMDKDEKYKQEMVVAYHGNTVKSNGHHMMVSVFGIFVFAGLFLVIGFVCGDWCFYGGVNWYHTSKSLSLSDETESEDMDE